MSSQILKKINKTNTFILSTLILVTACSKTPSKSDITASLEREAAGNCKVLDFQNVEKINGIELSPTEYRISAKYDVVIKPIPELTEPWTELNRKEEVSKQLLSERDSAYKSVSNKYDPEIKALWQQREELASEARAASRDVDSDPRDTELSGKIMNAQTMKSEAQGEVSKQYDQAIQDAKIGNLSEEKKALYFKAMSMLAKQCKQNTFGWNILHKAFGEDKVQALTKGVTTPMTAELTFVKTENGWRLDL